jgi:hypothetical protein
MVVDFSRKFTIKPLEWHRSDIDELTAETHFGSYQVERKPDGQWCWSYCYGMEDSNEFPCANEEEGKNKAQEVWFFRAMADLVSSE